MPMSFTSGTGQTGLSFTETGNPRAGAGVGEVGGQESNSGLSGLSICSVYYRSMSRRRLTMILEFKEIQAQNIDLGVQIQRRIIRGGHQGSEDKQYLGKCQALEYRKVQSSRGGKERSKRGVKEQPVR